MSTSLSAGEGVQPGAKEVIMKNILKKSSELLVHIIGEASTNPHNPQALDVQSIGQFQDVMEEATALWESSKHDKALLCKLATCAANVEAAMDPSCDLLYRLSKCKCSVALLLGD